MTDKTLGVTGETLGAVAKAFGITGKLFHSRGVRSQIDVGEYYIVDVSANFVLHRDVGLEALAKKLGALKPYECLV